MNKMIPTLALGAIALLPLQSCDRAQANVQTLFTSDCGQTWELIKAGNAVPKALTPCEYKITVPDYPMQGNSKFKGTFKDRVLANIDLDYDYVIFDASLFISEAKYLGKSGSDAQDESNSSLAYETAENQVIDKRFKDVARRLLPQQDIVDFDQSDFENILTEEVNKQLSGRGIRVSGVSFVPIPSEQTAQAIDIATAYKIYESKGLQEVGKAVMTERAGATKIEVQNVIPQQASGEE
jgi:hypothetical protein